MTGLPAGADDPALEQARFGPAGAAFLPGRLAGQACARCRCLRTAFVHPRGLWPGPLRRLGLRASAPGLG